MKKNIFLKQIVKTNRIVLFLFIFNLTYSIAYSLNVPYSGNNSITTIKCQTLYDHAGGGDYSSNANGYTVLNPSPSYARVQITGNYNTELGFDYIRIYSGVGTGGALLQELSGSNASYSYTGAIGQTLTVRFSSDGSITKPGFAFNIAFIGYEIGVETGTHSAPTCSNNTFGFGSGAYQDFGVLANTYYYFNWTNGSTASGFRGRPTNGSGSTFTTNQNAWFSGTTTNVRFSSYRNNCTWSSSSSTLTYKKITPTPGTSSTTQTNVCTGASVSFSATAGTNGNFDIFQYKIGSGGSWTDWGASNPHVWSASNCGNTRYVRARYSNGGCYAYSNEVTTQVVCDPSAPTITKNPNVASVCAGASLAITSTGGSGGISCNNQYRYDNGSGFTNWSNSLPSFTAVIGTNTVESRRNCTGPGCGTVVGNTVSWTVVADPSAPTITKSPNVASVCAGATLTVTSSGGAGGVGCNNQYRYSTNNGSSWSGWSATIPSFTAIVGTNIVESRRNCTGSGCGTAVGNTVSWTVVADPSAPTITKSPNVASVCAGATLTVTSSGGSGGVGCNNQYRYSINNGGSWSGWSATIPSFTAIVGTNKIQSSRECSGSGCNSNVNEVSWTVAANPIANAGPDQTGTQTCGLTIVTLAGNTPSAGTGLWSIVSGIGGSFGSASSPTSSFSGTAGNSYTLRWTISNSPCPSSSDDVNIKFNKNSIPATTATSNDYMICLGESITLSLTGGSLGTGAIWQWKDATNTVIGTGTSIVHTPSVNSIYHVRAVGFCPTPLNTSTSLVVVNGSNTYNGGDVLATTNSSSTCNVSDNNWHYFYNAAGEILGGVNSHNIILGNVTFNITVNDNNTYGIGLAPGVCGYTGVTDGEYILPRHWEITTQNQPGSGNMVDILFFYGDYDISDLVNTIAALPYTTDYIQCWGDVQSDADLMMTVEHSNGSIQLFPSLSPTWDPMLINTRRIQFQLDEFSSGKLHSKLGIQGANPLPVELLTFKVQAIDNKYIAVNWETATEINNDGFELLRSTDGVNFEKIAWIKGNGNTSNKQSYAYNDYNVSTGIYYYKLRQIDFDGEAEDFYIVSASINKDHSNTNVSIRPIPTSNTITIDVNATSNEKTQITVYNYAGKKVLEIDKELFKGSNNLKVEEVSDLPSGIYYLEMTVNNKTYTEKFVVLK